jgi:hypothetical protein
MVAPVYWFANFSNTYQINFQNYDQPSSRKVQAEHRFTNVMILLDKNKAIVAASMLKISKYQLFL